jgi:Flp pilus assembly protein TadG
MINSKLLSTRQRGQDMLEFAIVLPLLLLILFGVLDLGRVFHAAITITNIAREGARHASIYPGATQGEVAAVAHDEALNSGVDLSSSVITRSCTDADANGTCDSGFPVRVTITYNFDLLFGEIINLPQIQLTRYVEMYVP